jgi:hypothetical protein
MLSAHSESRNVSKLLIEELSIATRDDVDDVLRVGSENLEALEERGRGSGRRGVLDDRSEGTVVVEHEETLASGLVLGEDDRLIERRGVLRSVLALLRLEKLEDIHVSPDGGGLGGDGAVEGLFEGEKVKKSV